MKARALAIALLLQPCVVVAGENLGVPRDLYEFIKSQGCEQISDFFNDRVSAEYPPYAVRVGNCRGARAAKPRTPSGFSTT